MKALRTYNPFFLAALLLCIVLMLVLPYYRFYIDSDATAYLTITRRYASGQYMEAVNGYWSPWSCWLSALLMKTGAPVQLAGMIINIIGAALFLFISQSFFILFKIEYRFQLVLCAALALFLCYAVFKQGFDDLWECFFLLSSLRIMLGEKYIIKQNLWVLNGALGAMAYFAKAYAFPYFIVNTLLCHYFLSHGAHTGRPVQWVKATGIAIAVMLFLAMPWMYLLYLKYGTPLTSTAGTLNLSWYPVGHPYFKESIHYLVPPIYKDSPSYWEDPWLVNGITPHFWNSSYLFFRQTGRVFYDILLFVKCINEMSPFMLPVVALASGIFISKTARLYFGSEAFIVSVSFLVFPLGFLLINYEARYIWYMLLPGMVLGAVALQRIVSFTGNKAKNIVIAIYAFSFVAYPAWDMKQMYNQGKEQYIVAQQLNKAGIKGSFTSNVAFGETDFDAVQQIAYYSGNSYYQMPYLAIPYDGLLKDIRRYDVKYFYYFTKPGIAADIQLKDESGKPFPEITNRRLGPLRIFQMN